MRTSMIAIVLVIAFGTGCSQGAEQGCDDFKWPIHSDRAALVSAPKAKIDSGMAVPFTEPLVMSVGLVPVDSAVLPHKPERNPGAGTFSGFLTVTELPRGTYAISLADAAWIDAVQEERLLKPLAFSGATGCEGIRKIVRFEFAARPLMLQFTGVNSNTIAVAIRTVRE